MADNHESGEDAHTSTISIACAVDASSKENPGRNAEMSPGGPYSPLQPPHTNNATIRTTTTLDMDEMRRVRDISDEEKLRLQRKMQQVQSLQSREFHNSGNNSSASSSSSHGATANSGEASFNTVTATTTTTTTTSSGSDDRGTANSSSDGDGDKKPAALLADHHSHSSSSKYHHHHHRRHTQQQLSPTQQRNTRNFASPSSSDEVHGLLPAAAAGHLDSEVVVNNNQHATVVAHLPAPPSSNSEGNSSGSGNEGEGIYNSSTDLLEPHKEPGFHKIKSTFERLTVRGHHTAKETEIESLQDKKMSATPSNNSSGKVKTLIKRSFLKPSPASPAVAPNDLESPPPKAKVQKQKFEDQQASGGDSSSGSEEDRANGGSSSGSGTEGGYAGSASSNDVLMNEARRGTGGECSSSSPSVSSSEDNLPSRHHHHSKRIKIVASAGNNEHGATRPLLSRKTDSNLSMGTSSSDIADFSSGATESKVAKTMKALQEGDSSNEVNEESSGESISSGSIVDNISAGSLDGGEDLPHRRRNNHAVTTRNGSARGSCVASNGDRKRRAHGLLPRSLQLPSATSAGGGRKKVNIMTKEGIVVPSSMGAALRRHHPRHRAALKVDLDTSDKPPIMTIGSDVMAHVLTFLEPPEILSVLTMPLSMDWIRTFTRQSELWRVLCLVEPFKAQVEEDSDGESSSENEFTMYDSFPLSTVNVESELRIRFGKFRILYTSFVRCMRYLARIKDDALNGRPPSVIDYGTGHDTANTISHTISSNQNLQDFLARARGVVEHQQNGSNIESLSESSDGEENDATNNDQAAQRRLRAAAARAEPIGVSDDGSSTEGRNTKKMKRRREKEDRAAAKSNKRRKVKYGTSKITQRLLLPAAGGVTSHNELPWSCAIYSIVNWMVGFADVEGIQTMCLKVLPFLLEDEQQRMTAQRAGLTDVVLRDMVLFPNSCQLHTAAFHTIVLLARPLGGREGMLFHTSMVNSSGIFNSGTASGASNNPVASAANGKNGIAVMLDSMRRFQSDEVLQAMSCWSLVNIALAPAQKDVLLKLGGIEVTTNAMCNHPHNAEVQFRALFALINLVIPCVNGNTAENVQEGAGAMNAPSAQDEIATEREVLDDMVEQVVELVVLAMKNFCSSESILNRACLVLHNLSLTQEYHGSLLWTPNCYQMLEWCLSNYPTDQVLQQSAAGTLHRLQLTLSTSENLRSRFNAALASQQQLSLEQAHREAVLLYEQQQLREQEETVNI